MDYTIEDWLADLNTRIARFGQTRDDLAQIIHLCEEALGSLEPVFNYVRGQRSEIVEMMSQYDGLYRARFKEAPPELPADRRRPVKTLSASSERKDAIRRTALQIAEPGKEVTAKEILDALIAVGVDIGAQNPRATIATVLNGFKEAFVKLKGKRGAFRRLVEAEPSARDPDQ